MNYHSLNNKYHLANNSLTYSLTSDLNIEKTILLQIHIAYKTKHADIFLLSKWRLFTSRSTTQLIKVKDAYPFYITKLRSNPPIKDLQKSTSRERI